MQTLTTLFGTIALLLVVICGFCFILQARKLASRLLAAAIFVGAAPFGIVAVIGSIHSTIQNISAPILSRYIFGILGVLGLSGAAWFALRLKGLHIFQNWLVPRFGPEVDGQVTGTYAVRLMDSVWGFLKFLAVIAVLMVVLLCSLG